MRFTRFAAETKTELVKKDAAGSEIDDGQAEEQKARQGFLLSGTFWG